MKKYFLFIVGLLFVLTGCQHNDICIEEQPSTPKLIVKFFDSEITRQVKPIDDFNAREVGSEDFYFDAPVTDTVLSLPLKTDKEFTTYEFVVNQEDSVEQKSDTLKFVYKPVDVYISRPCGFISNFEDFKVDSTNQTSLKNWIIDAATPHSNIISDEEEAHLYIYH